MRIQLSSVEPYIKEVLKKEKWFLSFNCFFKTIIFIKYFTYDNVMFIVILTNYEYF